ncbi:hypothetical protein T07_5278 [Trichinella nelsoni]|uniref:Uncharacterized protein n=1 Tax=Trichinella nelsoni TaxID=6336 RepID=A0A0V0SKG2_9BILA|nr:hypothetical protein T07_5278 [Trichinella nelsoni]
MVWRITLARLRSSSDVDSTSANFLRITASVDQWLPLASCSLGSIFSIASPTRCGPYDQASGILLWILLQQDLVGCTTQPEKHLREQPA